MIEGLTCEQHPGVAVVGACARCGVFICDVDKTLVGARFYCPTCAARPEVNWLDQLRAKWLGARDGWCWVFLAMAVLEVSAFVAFSWDLVNELSTGRVDPRVGLPQRLPALALLGVEAGLHALFLLGRRWIRWAIGVVPLAGGALAIAQDQLGVAVYWFLMFLFAVTAWSDTRDKLFFRLPVSDHELGRYHDKNVDNPMAQWGSRLTAVGLIVPFAGLVGLVLGAIGLSRVDPTATPPVGKRWLAVFAVAVGFLETLLYGFAFFR